MDAAPQRCPPSIVRPTLTAAEKCSKSELDADSQRGQWPQKSPLKNTTQETQPKGPMVEC